MYLNRMLNVTQKKGDHGNMVNCLKINDNDGLITYLNEIALLQPNNSNQKGWKKSRVYFQNRLDCIQKQTGRTKWQGALPFAWLCRGRFSEPETTPSIPPWDTNHKTVRLYWSCSLFTQFLFPVQFPRQSGYKGKNPDFYNFGKNPKLCSLTLDFFQFGKYPDFFTLTKNCSTHVQHVPITMITKLCKRKQTCCKVTYCPLVPAWATTIHKFQGFEAGFDKNDQFNHLIVDPGDLTTELLNPGTLYVALSRAKSIGTITPDELHPKNSAIFWTGSGMYLNMRWIIFLDVPL